MNAIAQRILRHWRIDLAGLAILVGLTIGAFLLQIHPLLRSRRAYTSLSRELAAKQHKVVELKDSSRAIAGRRDALQRMLAESNLPLQSVSQLNQRILRLTELATENGLTVDAIEPGKSRSSARYEIIPIHLSGRGDYRSCTKFLKSLHSKLRDSGTTRVELSASPGVNNNPTAGFAFDLVWYTAPARIADTK